MNYSNIYERIVARGRERVLEGYKERHHIIPRCLGGTDDPENLVDLTPEEHYVCHQLLVKMYPNNRDLHYAVMVMSGKGNKHHEANRVKRNKLYGWLKRSHHRTSSKEVVCEFCGTLFTVLAHKKTKFCSQECYHNKRTENNLFTCIGCGTQSSKTNRNKTRKYCSLECAKASRKATKSTKLVECECKQCSKIFYRYEYQFSKTAPGSFCSRKCAGTYQTGKPKSVSSSTLLL